MGLKYITKRYSIWCNTAPISRRLITLQHQSRNLLLLLERKILNTYFEMHWSAELAENLWRVAWPLPILRWPFFPCVVAKIDHSAERAAELLIEKNKMAQQQTENVACKSGKKTETFSFGPWAITSTKAHISKTDVVSKWVVLD